MEPVVDGAAGGNVGQRQVDGRSAAGRAALADPPAPPPPTPTLSTGGGSSARRRPLRILLVAVALLAVLVAGSVLTYNWALGHWFVGVEGSGDDGQVAVFRGLDVSVIGFDLFELDESTDLAVTDLTAAARSRVRGRDHRRRRAGRRADPRRAPRPAAPGLRHGVAHHGVDAVGIAGRPPSAPPAPGDPAATGAPATTAAPDSTTSAPTTSARTPSSSEPGVDCREAD